MIWGAGHSKSSTAATNGFWRSQRPLEVVSLAAGLWLLLAPAAAEESSSYLASLSIRRESNRHLSELICFLLSSSVA